MNGTGGISSRAAHNALTRSSAQKEYAIDNECVSFTHDDDFVSNERTSRTSTLRMRRAHAVRESEIQLGVLGKGKFDYTLALVAALLSILGLVFIYSASCYSAKVQTGDAFRYVKTQAVALCVGLFLSVLCRPPNLRPSRKFHPCFTSSDCRFWQWYSCP